MNKVSLLLVVLMLCASVQAVTITTADDTVYDSLLAHPDLLLGLGTGAGDFGFGDDADTSLAQTVTVGAASIDVTQICLIYKNDDRSPKDSSLIMHVFEVADPEADITLPGTTLLTESFVLPYSTADTLASISLDSALTLAANTSYAVYIDTSDTGATAGDGNPGWEWLRSSTAGNVYAGGALFENGFTKGTGDAGRDASLILIPEPATLALLGVGMVGLIRKRK